MYTKTADQLVAIVKGRNNMMSIDIYNIKSRVVVVLIIFLWTINSIPSYAHVIDHNTIKAFKNDKTKTTIKGISTQSQGAKSFEVWQTSIEIEGSTPLHTHDTEEIFIFLKGKGKAIIGEETVEFSAPCTLIAPANIPHQYFNTGQVSTNAIVILGIGSKIFNHDNKEMILPWR